MTWKLVKEERCPSCDHPMEDVWARDAEYIGMRCRKCFSLWSSKAKSRKMSKIKVLKKKVIKKEKSVSSALDEVLGGLGL